MTLGRYVIIYNIDPVYFWRLIVIQYNSLPTYTYNIVFYRFVIRVRIECFCLGTERNGCETISRRSALLFCLRRRATVFPCVYITGVRTHGTYIPTSIVGQANCPPPCKHPTQHEVRHRRSVARVGGNGRRRLVGACEEGRRVEEQQRTVRVRGRVQDGQEDDCLR